MIPAGTQEGRVLSPTSTGGLPRSEVTIAEALRDLGCTYGRTDATTPLIAFATLILL